MESLAPKLRVPPVRLDCDCHSADRVLCRLGSRRVVGGGVMMIVVHGLGTFLVLSQFQASSDWKLKHLQWWS
jgi:hypothetical protein